MVEGFYAAVFAEGVFGGVGTEKIGGDVGCACEELEVLGIDDEVLETCFVAHGTITVGNGQVGGGGDLKRDCAAVTAAFMPFFLDLGHNNAPFSKTQFIRPV